MITTTTIRRSITRNTSFNMWATRQKSNMRIYGPHSHPVWINIPNESRLERSKPCIYTIWFLPLRLIPIASIYLVYYIINPSVWVGYNRTDCVSLFTGKNKWDRFWMLLIQCDKKESWSGIIGFWAVIYPGHKKKRIRRNALHFVVVVGISCLEINGVNYCVLL